MSRIKITNFGPVRKGFLENNGWLDINKVTVFVGNQGSGKSTVAKLIATFAWIEKALVRGDYNQKWFERINLKRKFLPYHRIETYVKPDSTVEYEGDKYHIKYQNERLFITEHLDDNKTYDLPQLMYIPSERNLVSCIREIGKLKSLSGVLVDFDMEFDRAKLDMKEAVKLPLNNASIKYNKLNDTLYLIEEDSEIALQDAASGFQSFVPMYLVSRYLANSVKNYKEVKNSMSSEEKTKFKKMVQDIWANDMMSDEQKSGALTALSAQFAKTGFINIVEEPEQNLFPVSQWQALQSLLSFNNMSVGNKLIMTTHSPYLVNYLTLAAKAGEIKQLIKDDDVLQNELYRIIPFDSTIESCDLSIYELDENTGTISLLATEYGLPSDENKLNMQLDESNNLFSKLLDIQQQFENTKR